MLIPRKEDAIHKAWLLRLLTAICEHPICARSLAFKGGTCAAMRGFLDRFSVDLDFDILAEEQDIPSLRKALETVFTNLNLTIKDSSKKIPQYFVQYPVKNPQSRNTIKIDMLFPPPKKNEYEMVRLPEIDRVMKCQTRETMVANKFVALIARSERTGKIAGRDLFDVHHFLLQGYSYNTEIIPELRQCSLQVFFRDLINFVEKNVTRTLIDQDLNVLLPLTEFRAVRNILKEEIIRLLRDELQRVGG
ncbi:nucleotidyl transferase AbiEii/AbiGii toxin family protein [Candidatus Peregrinibacteria bacterium]|nr:nucleotidyl transferase AbiEii/AbiGii toxin family protein [Candidatus Peregrinibacteria bacterium]